MDQNLSTENKIREYRSSVFRIRDKMNDIKGKDFSILNVMEILKASIIDVKNVIVDAEKAELDCHYVARWTPYEFSGGLCMLVEFVFGHAFFDDHVINSGLDSAMEDKILGAISGIVYESVQDNKQAESTYYMRDYGVKDATTYAEAYLSLNRRLELIEKVKVQLDPLFSVKSN